MVLNELGNRITAALHYMSESSVIDDKVIDACLKEICTALLQADVNVKLVMKLRENVKARANKETGSGLNKRKIIEKAVFDELVTLVDGSPEQRAAREKAAAKKKEDFKKGQPNVVMFVGLQGSGKTTTVMKYAHYYKKKGYKPAMICADTFRAGAFDQLKQNATKAGIPFYGSYTESDPAVISAAGVERFKADGRDLIIVDTSGRHKQEAALFEEMKGVAAAVAPDLVVFVMDSSIGQAAQDQAAAFRSAVPVGQVVVTKMDGHARGGGALSAVAATKSPIAFIGTGEHMDEFEKFDPMSFVGRLLGKGDWSGFMNKIQDVMPEEKEKEEIMENISKGNFSLRILYDQLANIQRMGPVSSLMGMLPGMNAGMLQGNEKESQARIKKFMCIMDSMTAAELDSNNPKLLAEPSRIMRVARGAGRSPYDVQELLEEYKRIRALIVGSGKGKGGGGMAGMMKGMPKGMMGNLANMNPHNMQMNMQQMSRMLPPNVLNQMGGMNGLQGLMKQFAKEGMK